jgi:hypothetical protein
MPRKTEVVVIPLDGRDKGKAFQVTEMGAVQGERWATRALLALGRSGIEVPDELRGAGMAGIAIYGVRALARVAYEDAKPLLDEMLRCVKFVPDPRHPTFARDLVITEEGEGDDVEEISTLLYLRSKVFELHTGFSLAEFLLPGDTAEQETGNLSPTQTSLAR